MKARARVARRVFQDRTLLDNIGHDHALRIKKIVSPQQTRSGEKRDT